MPLLRCITLRTHCRPTHRYRQGMGKKFDCFMSEVIAAQDDSAIEFNLCLRAKRCQRRSVSARNYFVTAAVALQLLLDAVSP